MISRLSDLSYLLNVSKVVYEGMLVGDLDVIWFM